MHPEYMWWGGWWIFPIVMPLIMIVAFVSILYLAFGRGGFRPPWRHDFDNPPSHARDSESAIEILKKRYAKGELTREEFEQM